MITTKSFEASGSILAPPSKSYTHRYAILSSLCSSDVVIRGVETSDDILATLQCLKKTNAEYSLKGDKLQITPVKPTKTAVLDCVESGSTLRFLLPMVSAYGGEFKFVGIGNLPQRPIEPLIDTLKSNGVEFSSSTLPFKLNGKLKGGDFLIDGSISSQFVSGLMMCSPLIGEDINIIIKNKMVSAGYVDVTIDAMSKFGVRVERTAEGFFIKGGQKYVSPKEIFVEGDWSNVIPFFVMGLLCGRLKILGLNAESKQGDRRVLDILKTMGGNILYKNNAYIAQKSHLFAINEDMSDCPDAIVYVACACAFAKGESKIQGVKRLIHKESDRLFGIIDMINRLGGKAYCNGDTLTIVGASSLSGAVLDCKKDHRLIMTASIFGSVVDDVKFNIEGIKKSYPAFFTHYLSVGGKLINE